LTYLGPNGDFDSGPSLVVAIDDGVLNITFNTILPLAMERLLTVVKADDAVRVVVLRGYGTGSFGELATNTAQTQLSRSLSQPVLVMVHGMCNPQAVALIESCDIVICADDATFEAPKQPNSPLNAQAAQKKGLVSISVPASELESHTDTLARELANKDTLALRFTKQTLRRVPDIPWNEVLAFTSAKQIELKALQAGRPSARASAIESFLAGKSKPGAGA